MITDDHPEGTPTFWAAAELIDAGYKVFPADPDKKDPTVKGGFYAATDDKSQVAEWIVEGREHHNIAVATGVFGAIVAIDADTRKAFEKMRAKYGDPAYTTKQGGHWLFRHPRNGKVVSNRIGPGLDRKGDGGYVLFPPSLGRQWTSEAGALRVADLPALPREFWSKRSSGKAAPGDREIPEEKKEEAAEAIAARVREITPNSPRGGRHEHLRHLCGVLLGREFSLMDAEDILKAAWGKVGGDLTDRIEDEIPNTLATTRAAMDEGRATGVPSMEKITPGLYDELAEIFGWLREAKPGKGNSSKAGAANESPASSAEGKPTDDELRDRFLERRPDYSYGLGTWRRYGSGVWEPTEELGVKDDVCRTLEDAKDEKVRPNRALVLSVSELAKARISIADDRWDADPDVLVCANGALRLSSRELEPHSPEHYATSGVPYDYDPDATSEVWEKRVMGELIAPRLGPEAVEFIQEFAGYALTTDTSHEIALWFTGKHGGGRSTILAGFGAMLGARTGVLSLSDLERSSFALTNLPGKTLVTATEQPSTFLRGGGVLNAIISGEPIQIDLKFRDPIEITPRAKIAWAMNELPRVGNPDDGIFRRVRVIAIPEIPPDKRDPQVKEDVKASGAGILNWALDGLERLHKRGHFLTPEKVKLATDEFKEDNDIPALFVAERCDVGPKYWEKSALLYDEYKYWAIDNGHKPLASNNAAREWRRLGFEKKKHKDGMRWLGLKVANKANSGYFEDMV